MHLKPYNPLKTTCQALKNTNGHSSNFVGGLCFDIQSNDKTMLVFVRLYYLNI